MFSRSTDGGTTWSEVKEISGLTPPASAGNPAIAINSSGILFVTYTSDLSGTNQIYLTKSADRGETWSAPTRVAVTLNDSEWSRILIDSHGTLHVLWHDRSGPSLENVEFYHARSSDGGISWSNPKLITSGTWAWTFIAAIDAQDRLYGFWTYTPEPPKEGRIFCFTSADGGEHWDSSRIAGPAGQAWGTAGAIDTNGVVHVTYGESVDLETDHVMYVQSLDFGKTWGSAQVLASYTRGSCPGPAFWTTIAVDSKQHVAVAYQGRTTGNFEVFAMQSWDSGKTWLEPENLSHTVEHSLDPTVAVDKNGRIHLFWNELVEGVPNGLYYSQGAFSPRAVLSQPSRRANGDCELSLTSSGGLDYQIEFSADLKEWTPLTTLTKVTGTATFLDTNANQSTRRFYRAVQQ